MSIDFRKWFDRFQPQTLQIATVLLYINGFFHLINLADRGTLEWYLKEVKTLGAAAVLAVVACCAFGGLLMANDRKLGYRLALIAAFAPFALRFWAFWGLGVDTFDIVTGGRILSFIFEVALIALLLHPQSREHQRVWYK